MIFLKTIVTGVLGACLAGAVAAQPATSPSAPSPVRQSFAVDVPWVPVPATLGGTRQLVYELQLTNFSRDTLQLSGVDVLDGASRANLLRLQGASLQGSLGRVDTTPDKRTLAPGAQATVYLSVPVGAASASILHRIDYTVAGSGQHFLLEAGAFAPRQANAPALGPPLRGGPWVAIYDASWERGHRRVLYAVDGKVHVPGRFAIDWIKVDANGAHARGDGSAPSQWYGYGADVLAVADATVAATRQDMAEPATVAVRPARVPIGDATGNYVALALADGRFVFVEHLKPGSVRVRAGQHVRRGQVIGQLGFTGESTGPHLHMHVSDANAPLAAEGLPYVLEGVRRLGTFPSIEVFGAGQHWTPATSPRIPAGMPGPLDVVSFER